MGWNRENPDYIGMEVKVVEVHIKGTCPMCENNYDLKLEQDTFYKCPCGYFSYYAGDSEVSVDNHNIPKEEWQRRLRATQVKEIRVLGQTYKPTLSDLYDAIGEACYDQQNFVRVIFQDGSERDVAFRDDNSVAVDEFLAAASMAEELGIPLDS